MVSTTAKHRRKLFSIYSSNLSFYKTEKKDVFLCPVCLNEFSKEDSDTNPSKLALAHVIPRSIGGKLKTLICAQCDSKIGAQYDRHVLLEKENFDRQKGNSDAFKYAHLTLKDGDRIPIMLNWDGPTDPQIIISNPVSRKYPAAKWREDIGKFTGLSGEFDFSIEFKEEVVDPKKRNISLLYSAFLMMFHQFGYEYVLSRNVDRIRQIIVGKDKSFDLTNTIHHIDWDPKREMYPLPLFGVTRFSASECFSTVLVPFDKSSGYLVLLPGFGWESMKSYDDLLAKEHGPTKFNTKVTPNNITPKLLSDPASKDIGERLYKKIVELPLEQMI